MLRAIVQREVIDVGGEIAALDGEGGAIATFIGRVRGGEGVTALTLEHYPGATEAALLRLTGAAVARWSLEAANIVHRVGEMVPGEVIVFVGTAAKHRTAALEACAFLIDRLKTDAPFWKRETRADGVRWVESRTSDDAAAGRWGGK